MGIPFVVWPHSSQADPSDVVPATGNETVSFAGEIGPILIRECLRCHGPDRSRNGLSFENFGTFLSGGDSGPIIDRKAPEDSLLLAKLRGTGAGERMPLNRPPLADTVIDKFKTWIREGGTFDGKGPRIDLATLAAIFKAETYTHQGLAQERIRIAKRNWRLAMPDDKPNMLETEHFLVVGMRSTGDLREIADLADQQAATVRRLLKAANAGPFVRGRVTLYVMERRYDYVEFGKMVEQRQLPKSLRAHWNFSTVDAYGVVLYPREAKPPTGLFAEQIASIYVANLGDDVPRWFATGIGRAVAARIAPRDPNVSRWQSPTDIDDLKPADILAGKASPEGTGSVLFAFGKRILRNRRAFSRLKSKLTDGQPFDTAWQNAYGGSPQESLTEFLER